MHNRKEIKSKIHGYLSAKTSAGENVFKNRFLSYDDQDEEAGTFPAILVYCGEEAVSGFDSLKEKRTSKVYVECLVKGSFADDELDDLSAEVEDILVLHGTLDGLVDRFALVNGELGAGENGKFLAWKMTFEVEYKPSYPAGDEFDDLNTAGLTVKADGQTLQEELNLEA